MKFENDYIRIIIEKKQLTIEQKEAFRLKWKKRTPYAVTALVLVAAITVGTVFSHYNKPTDKSVQVASNGNQQEANGVAGDVSIEEQAGFAEEELEDVKVEGTYVDQKRLATNIQDKYGSQNLYNYTYGDPIEDLGQTEAIELKLGYDVMALEGIDKWYEIYAVYQDPELTQKVE